MEAHLPDERPLRTVHVPVSYTHLDVYKRQSLGSLAVVIIYLIEVVVYGQMGGFGVKPPYLYEMYGIAAFLMLSAFYKHKANIVRLMNGTENKISIGKK